MERSSDAIIDGIFKYKDIQQLYFIFQISICVYCIQKLLYFSTKQIMSLHLRRPNSGLLSAKSFQEVARPATFKVLMMY